MRKHVSCLECRNRKIRCDRNVPNCSSCVQRGIQHQCRWGDERDSEVSLESPVLAQSPQQTSEFKQRNNMWKSAWSETETQCLVQRMDSTVSGPRIAGLPTFPDAHNWRGESLAHMYADAPDAWLDTMESHLRNLPDSLSLNELVCFYLRVLEPLISCMNSVIFNEEYSLVKNNISLVRASYEAQYEPPRRGDIAESILGSLSGQVRRRSEGLTSSLFWTDPKNYGLLALLFVVVHTACDSKRKEDVIGRRLLPNCDNEEQLQQTLEKLYDSSTFFLHASDCQENPTLWTLQSIILLQRKPLFTLRVPIGCLWNSTALRLAQLMGLSRLGSALDDVERLQRKERTIRSQDEDILQRMPWLKEFAENDLPKRELGRKIWSTLVMVDWLKSTMIDFTYVVSDEVNCTAPPCALGDAEVVRIASLPKSMLKDRNRVSPNVFGRVMFELARCIRQSAAILAKKMSRHEALTLDYADIMTIDAQMIHLLDSLPNYFRFDGVSELSEEVQTIHTQHPYLSLQRLFLQEQIHFRMLRLHSPYLMLALRDLKYRRSLMACIEGARVTVAVWEELERTENPNQQMHYMKWHLLSAAIVLDRIIGSMDTGESQATAPTHDYSRLKSTLRKAVRFLEERQALVSFERFCGQNLLESLRRFCASPQESFSSEAHTRVTIPNLVLESSQDSATQLLDEFSKLSDALPLATTAPDWGTEDPNLMAGLEFLLMTGDGFSMHGDQTQIPMPPPPTM